MLKRWILNSDLFPFCQRHKFIFEAKMFQKGLKGNNVSVDVNIASQGARVIKLCVVFYVYLSMSHPV